MHTFARGALAVTLLASASAAPGISLSVVEPGFVAIDGSYYAYGLRQPAPPTLTHAIVAMLGSDGFHLQSPADIGTCQRADGSAAVPAGAGVPRLRHADAPLSPSTPVAGLALAREGASPLPRLTVASCQQINVLILRSAEGDLSCGLRMRFPFERGACPALDRADPTYISHGGFE